MKIKNDQLVIVMPTFNEYSNLQKLLPQIKDVFIANKIAGGVIVVDDNSPDGTAEFVRKSGKNLNSSKFFVDLLFRPKKMGLGTAYIAGFTKALTRDPGYILGMDADFSHNPRYIPEIFRQLQSHDVVIGSRYVPGGGIKNWNIWRRLLSKSASLYTKIFLRWRINDPTTAFVGIRTAGLKKVRFAAIKTTGYAFLIELKYLFHKAGFSIKEIPIIFLDRVNGKSKLSKKIIVETLFNTLILPYRYRHV